MDIRPVDWPTGRCLHAGTVKVGWCGHRRGETGPKVVCWPMQLRNRRRMLCRSVLQIGHQIPTFVPRLGQTFFPSYHHVLPDGVFLAVSHMTKHPGGSMLHRILIQPSAPAVGSDMHLGHNPDDIVKNRSAGRSGRVLSGQNHGPPGSPPARGRESYSAVPTARIPQRRCDCDTPSRAPCHRWPSTEAPPVPERTPQRREFETDVPPKLDASQGHLSPTFALCV